MMLRNFGTRTIRKQAMCAYYTNKHKIRIDINWRLGMDAAREQARLVELIEWIDKYTSGISFSTDEKTKLSTACFDVVLEHQASIALLCSAELFGSAFALLRVQTEALVRGMWLLHCASQSELKRFKKGDVPTPFSTLIERVELAIDDSNGVLSSFKSIAWAAFNSFTHTGFHQVSRRHAPGKIGGNYSSEDVCKAIGVAGAIGMVAAGQLISISDRQDLLPEYMQRMTEYAELKS